MSGKDRPGKDRPDAAAETADGSKTPPAARAVTPGRAIAFVLCLVALYFGWGMVFQPGGTGSNVVLGLLVALAALYLVTVNLGPAIDDAFFHGGDKQRAQLLRYTGELAAETEHALKRGTKGKKPQLDEAAAARIAAALDAMKAARDAVLFADKPTRAQKDALAEQRDALESVLHEAWGDDGRGGFLSQVRSLGIAFAIALALRAFAVEPFQIPSGSMIPTLLVGDHLFVARAMYGLQVPFAREPKYFVRWSVPQPGDVVVFVAPRYVGDNAGEDWIKRVVAGPGQRVQIIDNVLHVDGEPYEHVGRSELTKYLDYEEGVGRWSEQYALHVRERIGDRVHSAFITPGKEPLDWPNPGEPFKNRVLNIGPAGGLTCDAEACTVDEGHIFVMGDNRDHSSDGRRWGAVPIDHVKGRALFIWMSVDGSERSVDLGRFTLPRFRWERLFQGID